MNVRIIKSTYASGKTDFKIESKTRSEGWHLGGFPEFETLDEAVEFLDNFFSSLSDLLNVKTEIIEYKPK